MPGARMIFNARYFHIAKPGEALTKHAMNQNAAAGLVQYIATRESVVHNFTPAYELAAATDLQRAKVEEFASEKPGIKQLKEFEAYHSNPTAANATRLLARSAGVMGGIDTGEEPAAENSPATQKQKERIEEFLSAVPELKESMEYKDFLQSPTFENASEFLSNAFDNSLGAVVDPETLQTMVNYMATRPGVVKDGEHGLFSGDDVTDLEAYKKEVSEHTGNVYSTVVSLRREDADALGFDSQENWKNTVRAKLDVIAKNTGIPLSDLRWCAAMHNTGHHPHIHLMFWSKHPTTQNYLSEKGIAKIKSAFAHEIFRGEFEQIYEQQKTITHDLKEESAALLQKLNEQASEYAQNPALLHQFSELSADLSELQGKHQYKYLPKRLKEQVNQIVDTLGEIPEIKKLHELYEEQNNKMLSIYKESENIPRRKLSEAKSGDNLYFLKNLVIQTAENAPSQSLQNGIREPAAPEPTHREDTELISQLMNFSAEGKKEAALALGDIYAKGLAGAEIDPETAVTWYGIAANPYEPNALPMAAFHLSELLEDKELAGEFAFQAAEGFLQELKDSPNASLIQDLYAGKYSYTDREDYHQQQFEVLKRLLPNAAYEPPAVYQDSPENAERLFYLGKLFAEGHTFRPDYAPEMTAGIEQDTEKAKSLYQLALDLGYTPAAQELAALADNPQEAQHYQQLAAELLHEDKSSQPGDKGMPQETDLREHSSPADNSSQQDLSERTAQPEKTASTGQSGKSYASQSRTTGFDEAQQYYALGKKLAEKPGKAKEAFEAFRQAAALGNPWAQYKAAQYIYRGMTDLDRSEAHPYFAMAREGFQAEESEKQNAWRDYIVAGMYQKGLGTEKNEEQAQQYYGKALTGFLEQKEHPPWMTYIMGRMYRYGLGTPVNPEEALSHLVSAAEQGHSRAMYDAAGCYLHGEGVKADPAEAQRYYADALQAFIEEVKQSENEKEKKTPNEWTEYTIARMYANGSGTKINPEKAFEYYKLAADHGHTQAAYETGQCFAKGNGVPANAELAQQYYQKALDGFLREEKDAPNPKTEYTLAMMYQEGLGTAPNAEKAFAYMTKVAESGSGRAQYRLAEYLEKGTGTAPNPELAKAYYAKALVSLAAEDAEHPNAWTEATLAKMYEKGLGTTAHPGKAFEYYKQAADNGHTYAQYKTAEMLNEGTGTAKDPQAAQPYYTKALDGFMAQNEENPDAWLQYRIASMYEKSLGTTAHPGKAFEYYKQAADNGHTQAAYKVGEAYRNGNGVPVNDTLAQRYYKKALDGFLKQESEKPSAYTEYTLGRMYHKGLGTEKDLNKAREWYQKSAENGSDYAKQALENMDSQQQQSQNSALSGLLQSLLRTIARQMHEENVRQHAQRHGIDRKAHRRILEKKHAMGMKEDWEQTLE